MEGTCSYCGSGTSLLEIYHKEGQGELKLCPDCREKEENADAEQ